MVNLLSKISINDKTNRFLLINGRFIPEIRFKQNRFTQSTCGSFRKIKEQIQGFKKFKKQEVLHIFIEIKKIQQALSIIWILEVMQIYTEELLLINCYMVEN